MRDGEAVSCWQSDWSCRACLRLAALLVDVEAAMGRFRDFEEARALAAAVVPGRSAPLLDAHEARRVLLVLRTVLDARDGARRVGRDKGEDT